MTSRLARLPRRGVLRTLLPGSAQASLGSGGAWDNPVWRSGLPEVPGLSGDGGGGGGALRGGGSSRAEEVQPEVFPLPVSVRGAAAAAAGAAMPKGGEERARAARGPRGTARVRRPLSAQLAGVSENGAEGACPRRLRTRPGPRRPIVQLGKLRTVAASSHSLGGLRRLRGFGSSSTLKADLGRAFPGLGDLEFPPIFRLAGN